MKTITIRLTEVDAKMLAIIAREIKEYRQPEQLLINQIRDEYVRLLTSKPRRKV